MNILYLCDEYPPGKHGGIGTSVQLLARQMVKLGHNVVVAGLYAEGYGGDDTYFDEGVKVYRFRKNINTTWFEEDHGIHVKAAFWLIKKLGVVQLDVRSSLNMYEEELDHIIAEHRIDIVEMPEYQDYMRFCKSYVAFPEISVPVVVKMNGSHTYFAREAGKPVPAHVLQMEQEILNNAKAVVGVSKYVAKKAQEYFDYNKPIEIIPNGIRTDIPSRQQHRYDMQVIFSGSLVEKKGIYQLAKAWNIVHKQLPGARLVVLGKGSQQKVKRLLDEAAAQTVTFFGHVSDIELHERMCCSTVSVFPSYAEAFALAPLEGMASGTAVINSNRTSGPELIEDKVNGLLVDPDNVEALAKAIIYLLNNPDAVKILAENGQEKVKHCYDIAHVAAKNLKLYEKVLKGTYNTPAFLAV